jgi:glycosyltransferase involved in cell wall biosynthesis
LLGRFVHDRLGVAYGIDYIDPWVHDTVANGKRFSKAWASNQLARWLEPWALKHVRLLTGVAEGYFADVLARMPQLEQQAVTAAMGYGIAFEDFAHARKIDTKQLLFRRDDGYRHLVYAGALLPHGHAVVEQLFAALARLRWLRADLFAKLKVHFIGVGHDKVDDPQARLNELIKRFKLHEVVQVIPRRMQYLRVLRHLTEADACLVLGGEKSYYTPSKVYQALASGVPVLGVLHTASEAWRILGACPNACAVGYAGVNEPLCGQILIQLVRILESAHRRHSVSETSPHIFTARDSARRLAAALDKARSSALPLGVPTVAGSYG